MNSNNLTQVLVLLLLYFQYQSIFFLLELHPLEEGFGIEILGLFYGLIYASHQGGQMQVPKRRTQEEKNFKLVSLFEIQKEKVLPSAVLLFIKVDVSDGTSRTKFHDTYFLLHPRFIRRIKLQE